MKTRIIKQVSFFMASLFILAGCKTLTQQQVEETTINFDRTVYNNWIGGQPGVSGTTVKLYPSINTIATPDSLYFRNRVSEVRVLSKDDKTYWIAYYSDANPNDRKMCINTQDEYGNRPPVEYKIPYTLKEDEAMLSFFVGKQKYHYKIMGLIKEETLFYP